MTLVDHSTYILLWISRALYESFVIWLQQIFKRALPTSGFVVQIGLVGNRKTSIDVTLPWETVLETKHHLLTSWLDPKQVVNEFTFKIADPYAAMEKRLVNGKTWKSRKKTTQIEQSLNDLWYFYGVDLDFIGEGSYHYFEMDEIVKSAFCTQDSAGHLYLSLQNVH